MDAAQAGGMRTLAGAIAAVAVTVALTVGFVANQSPASGGRSPVRLHGDAVWAAGARPAPPMRLRDQRGQVVSLADLRDRVLLVTFMDSHCTKECPVEGHQLAVVQRAFPPRSRPEIVVVSVNPADTPRSARRFARLRGWHGAMALAHGIPGPAAAASGGPTASRWIRRRMTSSIRPRSTSSTGGEMSGRATWRRSCPSS